MLGGHKCYKDIGSRKRKFQSGRIGGAAWGLVFSMVVRGGLLEKVTFTRDLKLGRAGTAWVSWGAPRGTASTGPLLYPPLSSGVRFPGPALFTAPLLALQCECQNPQGQSAPSGGGWRRWAVLVGTCRPSEELLHLILTVGPERKMNDLILHWKKLRLPSSVTCLRWWHCTWQSWVSSQAHLTPRDVPASSPSLHRVGKLWKWTWEVSWMI